MNINRCWNSRNRTTSRPSGSARCPTATAGPGPGPTARWSSSSNRRIAKISEQIDKLTLIAPRDGQVMGVPHRQTIGQYLKPGKPFVEVGDPRKLEAHLILDQSDVNLVRSEDERNKPTAWVKIYGTSETTWKSYVGEVALRNREEIPPELSNLAGGEIATKQDEKTGQAKPLTAVYEVIIPIDNADLRLQPGLRGFAKIDGGYSTLAWWLWRLITKTFHFTL